MSSKAWKRLPMRVGAAIGTGALLFILFSSIFFYQHAYRSELQAADHSLDQLVATVEHSAAIAAYLDNVELALEAAQGLARNDIVAGVSVISQTGMMQTSGDVRPEAGIRLHRYPLHSPFGSPERIGEITIKSNGKLIEQGARQVARVHVLTMGIHALITVVLVIILMHWQLTHPVESLARQLHEIEPGSEQRLTCPRWHRNDEIHDLVSDSNHLLESVCITLDREKAIRSKVESLEKKFRLIFERASSGIALIDRHGRLLLFNPSFEKMIGSQRVQRLRNADSAGIIELFADSGSVQDALNQVPLSQTPSGMDLQLLTDGKRGPRWLHCMFSSVTDETGNLLIECIIYDVSERTRREKRTRFEAERDPLTQLFNRRAGERLLRIRIEQAATDGSQCALLMVDLDRFKPINDTHGHEAGDRVLVEVARRLGDSVRKDDLIIRWGGDEFLIVITQGHGEIEATPVAKKILRRLGADIDLDGNRRGRIGASIGIALFPEHGETPDILVDRADSAMYRVKQAERNGYCLHLDEPRTCEV